MNYYFSKEVTGHTLPALREAITAALQKEGFGILTEIDMQATMKKKLNKDYRPFLILGACNPQFADKVLQEDPHISTLLPCNVVLREVGDAVVEISMMDPEAAMGMVNNTSIMHLAAEVREKLVRALQSVH
jgi:uncharacterized protein (DUF302 family)